MFKNKILKSLNKGALVAVLSSVALLPLFSVDSNAKTTYYIRTLLDEGNFGVISQVITDKGESDAYLERDQGVDFSAIADYTKVHKGSNSNAPGSSLIANITKNPTEAGTTYAELKKESSLNMGLVFSFPGILEDDDITYTALSSDLERADLVSNTLTKGLNDALIFIKTHTGREHIAGEGLRHVLAQLARITAQFPNISSKTFDSGSTAGNKVFKLTRITGPTDDSPDGKKKVADELVPVNGLRYSDYVAISITESGKTSYSYFPWRMQKGYHYKSILGNLVGEEYMAKAKEKENIYLTWGQLIIQAGVNADLRSTSIVDNATDVMTLIGQGLGADLTSTITSVRSMLSLAPIQELILNMGSRSVSHHYGVMTSEMYDTAKTVYVLVLVVSLLFLSVLIVKMIHQKMISTTNIIAKTSLMEGLQDIVFVGVMLAFFPSIFEILLELNYWIVKTFSFSNDYLLAYSVSASKVLSSETLAGFIISSMFLSIDVYINTTYLVRALVVSFLFAISPILTVSYCWGPMQKKLYFGYMRELVGNIFMQSFHAITMTFFAGYNSTNMSSMEAIASAYCFIPITQLFRQLVIGSQGGFSESLGGKLAGQLTNTAAGLNKSGVAMKQSKELYNLQAENSAKSSWAGFGAQVTSAVADVGASALQNNLANTEIGNLSGNLNAKTGSNSSSIASSGGSGSSWKDAAKSAAVGVVGSGLGALGVGAVEKSNRSNLGELQMKHSMENIGIGLAQTGMGLGISSYDAGTGGGMIGAGMGTIQEGAKQYGEGQSNDGYGGNMSALAKAGAIGGILTAGTISRTGRDAVKYNSKLEQERNKLAQQQALHDEKVEKRGVSTEKALEVMGVNKLSGEMNPIIDVKPHSNNTNNVTFKADVKKLDNIESDNPIFKYLQELKEHPTSPALTQLAEKAQAAGLEMNHGGNGTGIAGDINNGKEISFVVNNISKYGLEFDNGGNAFTISDNTKLRD